MHTRWRRPMIVKRRRHIYLLLTLIIILVAVAMGLSACTEPQTAPTPPAPPLVPELTNSESQSRIAELEAQIRQLEAENQRLLEENRRLSNDLAETTGILQNLQSLVCSSDYINTLNRLTEVQYDTSELDAWVSTLPYLPPLPAELTPENIEWMVEMAGELYWLIYNLPPLPSFPPPPPGVREIEEARQTFLEVFEFVGELRDLPDLLSGAQSLDELRSRINTYFSDVQNTTSSAGNLMQEVKDVVGSR